MTLQVRLLSLAGSFTPKTLILGRLPAVFDSNGGLTFDSLAKERRLRHVLVLGDSPVYCDLLARAALTRFGFVFEDGLDWLIVPRQCGVTLLIFDFLRRLVLDLTVEEVLILCLDSAIAPVRF